MSDGTSLNRLRFDLITIRLFIATASEGSVTRAAERHHVAVAAASRRIAELEAQFGIQLFDRRPHGMVPTRAGRELLRHALALMQTVEHMYGEAQAHAGGSKGTVGIAACTSAVLQFLPWDIRDFQTAHPEIEIDLQELSSRGVVKAVEEGRAELGVYESSIGPVRLRQHRYRQDALVLVMPPDHPLAARSVACFADALPYEFVGLPDDTAIGLAMQRMAEAHGIALRMRVRVNSFDSMLSMIRAGIGIGFVPKSVAELFAAGPDFHVVTLQEELARRQFAICQRPEGELTSAAAVALRFLVGLASPDAKAGS